MRLKNQGFSFDKKTINFPELFSLCENCEFGTNKNCNYYLQKKCPISIFLISL